ncbi:MAG: VanZ family protein [Planctomycetes bacterium]|nr:VanZ family protein [Planctomycetota bacterium]
MSYMMSHAPTAPTPINRGVSAAFQAVLWLSVLLLATVFGHLHRYGTMDLLYLVCTLLVFWVVASLVVSPLTYVRTWVNPLVAGLLAIALLQFLPLPSLGGAAAEEAARTGAILAEGFHGFQRRHAGTLEIGRYSLRPVATARVFMLAFSAACLYWVVASSLVGRKRIRRATWAVVLGLVPLALWVVLSALAPVGAAPEGEFRPRGPLLVLGGDSLAPALLAALPLALAAVLRLLGWMPRRRHFQRQSRWGWLARAAPVWGFIGLAAVGLIAAAIGMSNIPWRLSVACVLVATCFVLVGFATTGPTLGARRRSVWFAILSLAWILVALGIGFLAGPVHQPAATADADLDVLAGSLTGWRAAFGVGAGAIAPGAVFGMGGWPRAPGQDVDTNGYTLVLVEMGWVGGVLLLAAALATVVFVARAWHRARSPWPRTLMRVGLGVVAANLLYFRFDASALLAPNLLALAAVLGIVTAWAAHGAAWRRGRAGEFGLAHWPFVFGAVALLAALSTAEMEMIDPARGVDVGDKVLHFGAFAVLCLLLCYAFGPAPTAHHLGARVLLAVLLTCAMAVMVEYAQRYLTAGRSFDKWDMVAGVLGAAATAVWWYVVRWTHVLDAQPDGDRAEVGGPGTP